MERLETFVEWIDNMLDTNKKRHIAGGMLLSVSLFFGGVAITILTIEREDRKKLL